jgi:hypothetical protein
VGLILKEEEKKKRKTALGAGAGVCKTEFMNALLPTST